MQSKQTLAKDKNNTTVEGWELIGTNPRFDEIIKSAEARAKLLAKEASL